MLPTVAGLVAAGACVSVDTMRAEVAAAAVARGRPAGQRRLRRARRPRHARHGRRARGGVRLHALARARARDAGPGDVRRRGHRRRRASWPSRWTLARTAGVRADRLVVDAGFGFAKTGEHNWELLDRFDELAALGLPQLVGVSRKSFLGSLLAGPDGVPAPAAGARRRDRRADHAAGPRGGLGRPGARGPGQPGRGRGGPPAVHASGRGSLRASDRVASPGEVG